MWDSNPRTSQYESNTLPFSKLVIVCGDIHKAMTIYRITVRLKFLLK